jgi:hypothetical protein
MVVGLRANPIAANLAGLSAECVFTMLSGYDLKGNFDENNY